MLERLLVIDRRWIFALVAVALTVPLFMDISCKSTISPETRTLFDALDRLRPQSKVLMSFDYDPASEPELNPMAEAFFKFALTRWFKIVIIGLWPQGPLQADRALSRVLATPEFASLDLRYGIDYVNLGYQAGNEFAIQGMGSSIERVFPRDVRGTPTHELPIMHDVKDFSNIDFVFNLSAGYPGTVEWVQVASDRFGVTLGAGNTAVQAPLAYPYLGAGQLVGLLGGMKGGAEFEVLTGFPGLATRFMVSQTAAHVVVIFFIVVGNAAFFLLQRRERRAKGGV